MLQVLCEGHNAGTALMGRAAQLKHVGHIPARDPVVVRLTILQTSVHSKQRQGVIVVWQKCLVNLARKAAWVIFNPKQLSSF